MELLANDLSLHEQVHDMEKFRKAVGRLMAMRDTARRFDREVYCHRMFPSREPMPGVPMQQAIRTFAESERRALMSWLSRTGPFWDDVRKHGEDDWLECDGKIITNSAIGEAAFRQLHDVDCGLISISPSDWAYSPVKVTWRQTAEGLNDLNTELNNWWCVAKLEKALQKMAPPLRSWDDLCNASTSRFQALTFSENCFVPLAGIPFASASADRFWTLLDILNKLARAFDKDGVRDAAGHEIYQNHFTGDRALFSDSSTSEKQQFRQDLTFPHPDEPDASLFCTWHGKVRHQTLRLHFSWPIEANKPVYVVYAGPKITKR